MPLNAPNQTLARVQSPYALLGLKDLPFPNNPVLDPYNSDPRRNGAIYAESTAREAIDKFERLLIRPDDFLNRVRLAYLWSKGDRESGRGMGKTALLRYFRQRINKDWGETEFGGQFSALVVYIGFTSQVDRRHMEQLALSALVDICKNGVLDVARKSLQRQVMTEDQTHAFAESLNNTSDDALSNDAQLIAAGINPVKLDEEVTRLLTSQNISSPTAIALANGKFDDYLRGFRKDGSLEPLYVPRDTKILDYSRTLLFNDIVRYLRLAGFEGGYLFIDDIENLTDQMARKDRIEFAKEFGLCTVRPGYANTEYNFFSSVLTTHQQASIGLSQAWGDAGLSAIARLDPSSPNSIELPFPSKDQAREIIVAHLDYYRTNPSDKASTLPFTSDGIDALLGNTQTLQPRVLLSRAANVIAAATEKKVASINAAFVDEASTTHHVVATPDFTDGIDGAL